MAFNKMMHPRNPYKDRPPNFVALAEKYADFRSHCFVAPNGKLSLNFRSSDAVRCLARAMLHNDFGLDVQLPNDCLVPRVPQRLNYILFIEDLLAINAINSNVIGIDIGTGASCIYALLGAKQYGWRFFATESDQFAAEVATNNVRNNGLHGLIEVVKVREDRLIKDMVRERSDLHYTFCMCNPPFYGEDEAGAKFVQLDANNTMENKCYDVTRRAAPRSATIARRNELSVSGGEIGFVGRLIDDSLVLQNTIKFYTSMVGKKASLNELIKKLKYHQHQHHISIRYSVSTLCQGRTQRWVLVWTFDCSLRLSLDTEQPTSINIPIPVMAQQSSSINNYKPLKRILDSLQINYKEDDNNSGGLICEAYHNTWSQQRQRRRLVERMSLLDEPEKKRARHCDSKEASIMVNMGSGDGRDSLSNAGNFCQCLLIKNNLDACKCDMAVQACMASCDDADQCLIRFGIWINMEGNFLQLKYMDGSKQSLHQIGQYLRNHFTNFI